MMELQIRLCHTNPPFFTEIFQKGGVCFSCNGILTVPQVFLFLDIKKKPPVSTKQEAVKDRHRYLKKLYMEKQEKTLVRCLFLQNA